MTKGQRERLQRHLTGYRARLACINPDRYDVRTCKRLQTYYENQVRHYERLLTSEGEA